jgi:hypothetical protein
MLPNQPIQEYISYCFRCKEKRKMANVEIVITKNNLQRAKGNCPICSANLSRLIGKKK